jgi:nucleoside-diphosphate-sugar epimerase/glyoxylase-like metal-dependent hydrolase (beta-lactamase superfamily II)
MMSDIDTEKFSGTKRRIVVTGATGFLGSHVVRSLLGQGVAVRALGRNLSAGLELSALGVEFRPVHLEDGPGLVAAFEGANAVVHCAALSSAWGARNAFVAANVVGTEKVIRACLAGRVERLVHISSPSVVSRHEDQFNLDESTPFPDRFVSIYSETKAAAEQKIREAVRNEGLCAVVLRPKAIYGPGDTALFPRLLRALESGRLPIFGDGRAMTNLTHVDDVVRAIHLALTCDQAIGRTYFITGPEEINLWDVVNDIARQSGHPLPRKRISVSKAMHLATALESAWRALPLSHEPPLTRYTVGIFSYSQTYSIQAAKRDLHYEPTISWRQGRKRLFAPSDEPDENSASVNKVRQKGRLSIEPRSVSVNVLRAGRTRTREWVFGSGTSWNPVDIPALFACIEHPERGIVLFDTGYHPRFFQATKRFPYCIYRMVTPVEISSSETAARLIEERGFAREKVEWIILSHFDPDHCGGLADFPNAKIVCSHRAWEAVRGKVGFEALRERLLPGLLPDDIAARLELLPDFDGPPVGPFAQSWDLFSDGSVRLVELGGHARGMIGAFVRGLEGRDIFFCGDAVWSRRQIEADGIARAAHKRVAVHRLKQEETYRKLEQLSQAMPDVTIVPTHCPAAERELRQQKR